jgi:hypothetical protein
MGTRQPRLLSYTEIETALTCWARWDFKYGGRLAGSTLKKREVASLLREGKAWGAAVAAWHQHSGELLALWYAHEALREAIDEDCKAMAAVGFPIPLDERTAMETRLATMLDHYASIAIPYPNLTKLEGEIVVGVPSRGNSKRSSTRYRFQCFLDGFTDDAGDEWVVEFKLRGRLTDPVLAQKQRQPRWYAWARLRETGRIPTGVYVDERLNEIPKAPRLTEKGKKPSHAKEQLTTPEMYADLCHEHGEMPKLEVMDALRARSWQQTIPLLFRPSELGEVEQEMISAAKLIRDLDSGELYPIRNASRMHCTGCFYRDICENPRDDLYVESMFERTVPKRDRVPEVEELANAA